jgi:predicted DNA-binding protein
LLTTLAQRKQQSLSNVAKDLIEASLERDEDVYFSRLADRRDTAATVWVADEKAWQ